jgi:tryptophan synthase alpha chain
LDRAGADIIEVGVPFSDPLADGPVIQRASERALAAGTTLSSTLELVGSLRDQVRAPMVLFSYANPIHRMGYDTFARRAADAGVDGVLTLDLPAEESAELRLALRASGIDMVFLLSPTTSMARMELAGRLGSGFLYAISRLGVTGAQHRLAGGVEQLVARIRQASSLPVAVGFGMSKPEHVREVGRWADAVVVGSALVQLIADSADAPDLDERVEA